MIYHCQSDEKRSCQEIVDDKKASHISFQKNLINDKAKICMYICFSPEQVDILDKKHYLTMRLSFYSNNKHKMITFETDIDGNIRPTSTNYFNNIYAYVRINFDFDLFDVLEMENPYLKLFEQSLSNIKHFQLYERGL